MNLKKIFIVFCKVSLFTLGGGLAMLPWLQKEIVEKEKWLSPEQFLDSISLAQVMPGVMIVNFAVAAGYRMRGACGAVAAAFGTVIPPFLAIIAVISFIFRIFDSVLLEKFFRAARPAVVALMLVPVLSLAKAAGLNRITMIIPAIVVAAIVAFKIHPGWVILAGGITALSISFVRGPKGKGRVF